MPHEHPLPGRVPSSRERERDRDKDKRRSRRDEKMSSSSSEHDEDQSFKEDVAAHFDNQQRWNQAMMHHHLTLETGECLALRIVKKGREGPSWKLWHSQLDIIRGNLQVAFPTEIVSSHFDAHDLILHCKCETDKQRVQERAKAVLNQDRDLGSHALVIMNRPSLRQSLCRAPEAVFSWLRKQLDGQKPGIVTKWPTPGRPSWAVMVENTAFVAGELLSEYGMEMRVTCEPTFYVNGKCFSGDAIVQHLKETLQKRHIELTTLYKHHFELGTVRVPWLFTGKGVGKANSAAHPAPQATQQEPAAAAAAAAAPAAVGSKPRAGGGGGKNKKK